MCKITNNTCIKGRRVLMCRNHWNKISFNPIFCLFIISVKEKCKKNWCIGCKYWHCLVQIWVCTCYLYKKPVFPKLPKPKIANMNILHPSSSSDHTPHPFSSQRTLASMDAERDGLFMLANHDSIEWFWLSWVFPHPIRFSPLWRLRRLV